MTARREPDRLIDAFLHEGAEQLHDQVYDAVRSSIEQRPQRVVIGPWRMPTLNKLVPIAIGVVAVVAVVVIGSRLLPAAPGGTAAGGPTAAPTAAPASAPTSEPTTAPSPTPGTVAPPPLTQTFTSTQHGISLSYPEGWIARPATEPWTDHPGTPEYVDLGIDVLHDPVLTDHLFLNISSRPIVDTTPEAWVAASTGCTTTEPIVVNGATGLIGTDDCKSVAVTSAGRGYWIQLLTSDDNPAAVAPYDRAWFEQVLATVQLQPDRALNAAASATP